MFLGAVKLGDNSNMDDRTRMKQIETQLQQVSAAMTKMQRRMGNLESSIGVGIDARIEQVMGRWRVESGEQGTLLWK